MKDKVINIAICDDEAVYLNKIKELIEKQGHDCPVYIDVYGKGMDLEETLHTRQYDLVFLDIEMPGINGFALAENIRLCFEDTEIVFVSSYENLVYQSFKFKPFRFIRKSHLEEEIIEVMDTFVRKFSAGNERYMEFKTPIGMKQIKISNIIYMESQKHEVIVNHKSGIFNCRDTMLNLEEKLVNDDFIRIHKGFLVNILYIKTIEANQVVLKNRKILPLGRSYKAAVKEKWYG